MSSQSYEWSNVSSSGMFNISSFFPPLRIGGNFGGSIIYRCGISAYSFMVGSLEGVILMSANARLTVLLGAIVVLSIASVGGTYVNFKQTQEINKKVQTVIATPTPSPTPEETATPSATPKLRVK